MKIFYFCILTIALVLSPVDSALAKGGSGASWLLGADLNYMTNKTDADVGGNTGQSESSSTFYDLSFGYLMGGSVYVGVLSSTKNTSSKDDPTTTTTTKGSAMAVSLGYVFDSGLYLNGNYFLSASDENYKGGSGIGVDIGGRSFLSNRFYVGAKLSYRSIKYTENTTISNFTSLTNTTTLPYLVFGVGF